MLSLRVLGLAVIVSAALLSAAHASTGVRVVGDPKFRAVAEQRLASWLARHGHEVTDKGLSLIAIAALDECYLGNDLECADKLFVKSSNAELFLYVNLELSSQSTDERTILATLWLLRKSGGALRFERSCKSCDDRALAALLDAVAQRVGSFEDRSGTLKLVSEPAGATVNVDGTKVGVAPVVTALDPGSHEVVVSRPGYVSERRTIEILAGGIVEQLVDLRRVGKPARPWRKTLTYGSIGAAGIAVVAGLVALGLNEGQSCEATQRQCRYTIPGAAAAFASSGVLLGIAGYLWFTQAPQGSAPPAVAGRHSSRDLLLGWGTAF
jgi:PEGA domain